MLSGYEEKYKQFLRGTSVRYEMYAEGIETGTKADVNNYKSSNYFSEDGKPSIGFFGMGMCEFEIEEKLLYTNEFIRIMASTPEYTKTNFTIIDELNYIYRGIDEESQFYNAYEIARKTAEELTVEPLFSISRSYTISTENSYEHIFYFTLYCGESEMELDFYWQDYESSESSEEFKGITASGVRGKEITTINVQINSEGELKGVTSSKTTYYINIINTNKTTINPSDLLNIFCGFSYKGEKYNKFSTNEKEIPFPVFTGFVKTIEEQEGFYKYICYDTSNIFDQPLTKEESILLGSNGDPKGVDCNYALKVLMGDYSDLNYPVNKYGIYLIGDSCFESEIKKNKTIRIVSYSTKREAIADICAILGLNAYADRYGGLVLKAYATRNSISINGDDIRVTNNLNPDAIYEDGVSVKSNKAKELFKAVNFVAKGGGSEKVLTIQNTSPQYAFDTEINIYAKGIIPTYNQTFNYEKYEYTGMLLTSITGMNCEIEMVGNFEYEVGEGICVSVNGIEIETSISKIEQECDGGLITKIYSYAHPEDTSQIVEGNISYSGGSEIAQANVNISDIQKQLSELQNKAVQSVALNGKELKSGTKATIPIASADNDGAITNKMYYEVMTKITTNQIDDWFGEPLPEVNGVAIFGNHVKPIESKVLLTNAIVGGGINVKDV